jgi:glucosamine-6-phosphate deaminase
MCIKEMKAGNLEVKIFNTRKLMGKAAAHDAAERIRSLLKQKEEINIVFAAAPSQNEFLAGLAADKGIDWNRINAFHMDEYIGLDSGAPQGFGNFLRDRLFGKVPFKSVHYLNGNSGDIKSECDRYAGLLRAHPTDIVCMGIGENGHIAFNDPHTAKFNDHEFVKAVGLDGKCRQQQVNDGCFASIDEVPALALTLTIPALMSCGYIFCIVPAKTKAEAVYNTIMGKVTEKCPASVLKTHKNAVLYADADSGSRVLA